MHVHKNNIVRPHEKKQQQSKVCYLDVFCDKAIVMFTSMYVCIIKSTNI